MSTETTPKPADPPPGEASASPWAQPHRVGLTLSGGETPDLQLPSDAPVPDTELTRILARRGTVRGYKPNPVPETWVNAIIENGMRAPTSSNIQAYSVIVIKDQEIRRQLSLIASNQQHIIDCPVFFAICADLNRIAHGISLHGAEYEGRTLEAMLVASLDASLMGMTMSLVSQSFGLSNVFIGALRNNILEVARILKLPPRCYVVFGMCIGWAKKQPLPKPRTPLAGVVHHDTYDPRARAQAVEDYDRELAQYYRARGVDTPDAAWSKVLAERYAKDRRKKLREHLNELGFPLE